MGEKEGGSGGEKTGVRSSPDAKQEQGQGLLHTFTDEEMLLFGGHLRSEAELSGSRQTEVAQPTDGICIMK